MEATLIKTNHAGYFERQVTRLLAGAGIAVNGHESHDLRVHNRMFYERVLSEGSLGLGESYMDGWWDCDRIDIMMAKIVEAGLASYHSLRFSNFIALLKTKLNNQQSKENALRSASFHYNLGNDLFSAMLDKNLTYTCGYWKDANTLEAAQEAKLDLTGRKLNLRPGMSVLDIGCGWGSFARYAAEKYYVQVTGITLSEDQLLLGNQLNDRLPVKLKLQDYRDLTGQYDRIVSLGMFEHVGLHNYQKFFKMVKKCLKPDGLFLLHTIGSNVSAHNADPWLSKYIFPNALIPSLAQLSSATEKHFVLEDLHNFGPDYDKTLMAWQRNFADNWHKLSDHYTERFYRMWNYYLLSCAGTFRARKNQLWQLVFSTGLTAQYASVR
ncbi:MULTISPECIES: cyclopropane fatty acyl phospholipid synthase [unclassified Imperialibacter]|uniref:cyclopropane fatty acyl phospholipid synthase n=1 Tax=unclassified Imperialibacter TaxID=2629706 RepID=UPI0012534F64|nr:MULTISPECIES: cyclopropane fatty acyl phospholipid synthase [unclassified Imperialibacter]CAD5279825.1 cyclopropane fatty acyl phospholipid synthase (unsaturated-phospholipid methyltransferase) [Imperialibacter sp. 75]CAD5288429.1 cyclopropane fatty acyl phospholipid synthase (unsaturated-phospholipid methyltransferase) [Imperialibacter sp. 89]VVT15875.1 cyclopropane fatty acyl phospholipid synthase (unsaturated-phospholipid methyltransferase) [Imperialibacter sp. EC-SDR9]